MPCGQSIDDHHLKSQQRLKQLQPCSGLESPKAVSSQNIDSGGSYGCKYKELEQAICIGRRKRDQDRQCLGHRQRQECYSGKRTKQYDQGKNKTCCVAIQPKRRPVLGVPSEDRQRSQHRKCGQAPRLRNAGGKRCLRVFSSQLNGHLLPRLGQSWITYSSVLRKVST